MNDLIDLAGITRDQGSPETDAEWGIMQQRLPELQRLAKMPVLNQGAGVEAASFTKSSNA